MTFGGLGNGLGSSLMAHAHHKRAFCHINATKKWMFYHINLLCIQNVVRQLFGKSFVAITLAPRCFKARVTAFLGWASSSLAEDMNAVNKSSASDLGNFYQIIDLIILKIYLDVFITNCNLRRFLVKVLRFLWLAYSIFNLAYSYKWV